MTSFRRLTPCTPPANLTDDNPATTTSLTSGTYVCIGNRQYLSTAGNTGVIGVYRQTFPGIYSLEMTRTVDVVPDVIGVSCHGSADCYAKAEGAYTGFVARDVMYVSLETMPLPSWGEAAGFATAWATTSLVAGFCLTVLSIRVAAMIIRALQKMQNQVSSFSASLDQDINTVRAFLPSQEDVTPTKPDSPIDFSSPTDGLVLKGSVYVDASRADEEPPQDDYNNFDIVRQRVRAPENQWDNDDYSGNYSHPDEGDDD